MVEDAIKQYDPLEPTDGTFIDDAPTVIPENWDAMEEMIGSWMQGLEITCSAAKTMTIDYTRLGMELNTGTPPLIFVDRSPSTVTIDWDNGEVMNGRETGLATTVGWKYIWIFRDDTNGVTSGLLSAATTIGSVVEPDTDFRFGRLIGAAYWDGASAFLAFIQRNNRVTYKAFQQILSGGRSDAAWSTAVDISTKVPSLAKRMVGLFTTNALSLNLTIKTATDNSGNYPGVDKTTYMSQAKSWRDTIFQELTAQSFSYWTEEEGGSIAVNMFLGTYWIDI